MPAELPGFYFDPSKNRYFPLSSKPKSISTIPKLVPPGSEDDSSSQSRKRRRISLWKASEAVRRTHDVNMRYKASHEAVCSQYGNTTRIHEDKLPLFGRIKSLSTVILNGATHRFIGDSRGWLYTSDSESLANEALWQPEINLSPESEVSSICTDQHMCIATSFGPSAKIYVQDLATNGRVSILSLHGKHDIWSSHLYGASLVLGVTQKALYMTDVAAMSLQDLETNSDVFTVRQHDNIILTGCRNGSIVRFDKRTGKRGQKLYNDRFQSMRRSSVLHLEVLADWQLLTSYMNGDLMTFDLRFIREPSHPIVQYHGHNNTYTQRLGIALDPTQEFLFAAGEDRRIRGWAVHTGRPLVPSPSHGHLDNPFQKIFPGVIETIQVTSEREGLCLWAGHDQSLYQIYLGQR